MCLVSDWVNSDLFRSLLGCYEACLLRIRRGLCLCDIFGYHIWLQSDAAFVYPRLDKYSLSVGMFWSTCCLSRSPLGRLATASSLAGNVS